MAHGCLYTFLPSDERPWERRWSARLVQSTETYQDYGSNSLPLNHRDQSRHSAKDTDYQIPSPRQRCKVPGEFSGKCWSFNLTDTQAYPNTAVQLEQVFNSFTPESAINPQIFSSRAKCSKMTQSCQLTFYIAWWSWIRGLVRAGFWDLNPLHLFAICQRRSQGLSSEGRNV